MTPIFFDKNLNIRSAREKAYQYLNIRLRDQTFGNLHLPARSLEDTVAKDLLKPDPDPEMDAAVEAINGANNFTFTIKDYDPAAEAAENANIHRAEREAAAAEQFKEIFNAIRTLADPENKQLDEATITAIKQTLRLAPAFLASVEIKRISENEVDAHQNIAHAPEIARTNEATRYRGAPHAENFVELPPGEPKCTRDLLQYIHAHFCTLELAVDNLLLAANAINAAFDGHELGGAVGNSR